MFASLFNRIFRSRYPCLVTVEALKKSHTHFKAAKWTFQMGGCGCGGGGGGGGGGGSGGGGGGWSGVWKSYIPIYEPVTQYVIGII